MSKRAWMVRAGVDGVLVDNFLKDNCVAIGESEEPDFSIYDKDQIRSYWRKRNPTESNSSIGSWVGVLWRFVDKIEDGDILVFKDYEKGELYLGYTTGGYFHDSSEAIYVHKRKVERWVAVKWDDLSKAARYSMRCGQAVFSLKKHRAELTRLMPKHQPTNH